MAGGGTGKGRKPRKDAAPRSAGAQGARKDGLTKTSLLIDPRRLHQLSQLACHLRRTQSEVVLDALDAYMPKFKLVRWLNAQGENESAPPPAGDVGEEASAAWAGEA